MNFFQIEIPALTEKESVVYLKIGVSERVGEGGEFRSIDGNYFFKKTYKKEKSQKRRS